MAVPTSVRRAAGLKPWTSFIISTVTMAIEPAKMISWSYGTRLSPMVSVKSTNTRLPPRSHQLARGVSSWVSSRRRMSSAPNPWRCMRRRRFHFNTPAKATPSTDITGMKRARA